MSEIPEDIIKTAETVYRNDADCPVNTIARAILAERERCATIAENIKAPKSIGRDHGRHHQAGAQSAARAIRNPITNPAAVPPPAS